MSIIALASNTLAGTPASGQIEYNGQFYATDSNASRGQLERIAQSTTSTPTGLNSVDFTSIPAWVKRITITLAEISGSGTNNLQVQVGSGSIQTTGYLSTGLNITSTAGSSNSTSAFYMRIDTATYAASGQIVLTNIGNTWVETHLAKTSTTQLAFGGGSVTLGGTLDRVRIGWSGADTFDAGSLNILYEG